MPDREKVIRGLERCLKHTCPAIDSKEYRDCEYTMGLYCRQDILMHDAIAMLKEQDAVEPKTEPSAKGHWYTCGSCGWWLFQVCDTAHFEDRKRIRFCSSCGRSVKWE